ncbi:hypothetical protein E3220_07510 [Piscirickettsia salmonis EM-90]|nr:hypothetical protein E3220_07510 [Piscirickettsia salmonis EM-90]
MLELLSHNCKEKASFFLIVFFNLLIVCQKLLIERYTSDGKPINLTAALLFQCSQMNTQHSQSNSSNGTNDNNDNWSDDWSDGASSPSSP